MGLCPLEPKEIDELHVPPGKAYKLLTDHLITAFPLRSELAQKKWFKSNHPYIEALDAYLGGYIFKHILGVMT